MNRFWIYILECENDSYYVGYTKNLARRFRQHVDGTAGVRYTRSFKPKRISQCWRMYGSVGSALKVERMIKKGGRAMKLRFIREPATLHEYASARLDEDADIFTFDAVRVQEAALALEDGAIRTAPDPFARARRRNYRPQPVKRPSRKTAR